MTNPIILITFNSSFVNLFQYGRIKILSSGLEFKGAADPGTCIPLGKFSQLTCRNYPSLGLHKTIRDDT